MSSIQIERMGSFLENLDKRELGQVVCFHVTIRVLESHLARRRDEITQGCVDISHLFHFVLQTPLQRRRDRAALFGHYSQFLGDSLFH